MATTPDTTCSSTASGRRREARRTGRPAREQRLPRPDSCLPRLRVEVEALNAARARSRTYGAGGRRASGVCRLGDRDGADPDGSVGRWRLHAAVMDRGYGAPASRSTRRRPRASSACRVTDQVELPRLKNPTNRSGVGCTSTSGATCSRPVQAKSRREGATSAPHPRVGPRVLEHALANIHPGYDDTHVDYRNPDRAPLLFISGSEDHLMPVGPALEREALQGGGVDHQVDEDECARTSCPRRRLGGDRRLRPRLGDRARKGTSHGVGNDDAVAALQRGGGSRSVAPFYRPTAAPLTGTDAVSDGFDDYRRRRGAAHIVDTSTGIHGH